jgi:hypothetical protein
VKSFAVLDTDATGRIVAMGHLDLLRQVLGVKADMTPEDMKDPDRVRVIMPLKVQEQLKQWPNPAGDLVRAFANDPPCWIEVLKETTPIHPYVQAELDLKHLDPGEAEAVSIAMEMAKDGTMGVVVSDEVAVQHFLNYEQNPERAREIAAMNAAGDKWHNFCARKGIQPPGPNTPDNRIAATENQRIFAHPTLNVLADGAERKQIPDLNAEVARSKDFGLTPSPRSEILMGLLHAHIQEQSQQQSQDHGHEH